MKIEMGWNNATIVLERRDDGGLRVHSPDMPGLILSGRNPFAIMADILPAMEILHQYSKTKGE